MRAIRALVLGCGGACLLAFGLGSNCASAAIVSLNIDENGVGAYNPCSGEPGSGWQGDGITKSTNDKVQSLRVPEPATIIIWTLLGAGSWLGMRVWRRRRRPVMFEEMSTPVGAVGRQPWSPEARRAIHEIIARGASH